jgi:hypothetical protein
MKALQAGTQTGIDSKISVYLSKIAGESTIQLPSTVG